MINEHNHEVGNELTETRLIEPRHLTATGERVSLKPSEQVDVLGRFRLYGAVRGPGHREIVDRVEKYL